MRCLLDTHAWLWALQDLGRLPEQVRRVLSNHAHLPFELSAISLWEVAKLCQKGRLRLTVPLREWMGRALDPDMIQAIPLSPDIVEESASLPGGFQADPADELIVATARVRDATLITGDGRIRRYPHVRTLWD